MCLAVPGKVTEVFEENGLKMGNVDFSGSLTKVCLEYVPEIQVGQYTVVHAGFAISVIDEEEAMLRFDAWQQLIEATKREGIDVFGNLLSKDNEG
ncbi:MAG: HypC/HybG/HupF family hydrogenase formation chaperone [Chlorobiales bacterium]|jgi:hydrogenase expression/formation protein HypC|nr:HypC/HybG/HupF family hydrogenase formation chaperone [Chlorobiales bacterium]